MSDKSISPDDAKSQGSRYFVLEHHPENGTLLGFWLYLMSDCLIFACLFAAYAVLGRNYAGGPTGAELFDLPWWQLTRLYCCCHRLPMVLRCWKRRKNV
jgi:cytochrome o ubiquinol oxidase subunit 3